MNITPEQFGPRRRIPIEERWREILPEIAPSELSELKAECKAIEAFALSLAEQVRDKKMADGIAKERLSQKYPLANLHITY